MWLNSPKTESGIQRKISFVYLSPNDLLPSLVTTTASSLLCILVKIFYTSKVNSYKIYTSPYPNGVILCTSLHTLLLFSIYLGDHSESVQENSPIPFWVAYYSIVYVHQNVLSQSHTGRQMNAHCFQSFAIGNNACT